MADFTNPGAANAIEEARKRMFPQLVPPGAPVPSLSVSSANPRTGIAPIPQITPIVSRGTQSQPSPAAVPAQRQPSANEQELQRLTAPPPADQALQHTKANTGASGVNQIHNPWIRTPLHILEAIGEGFAPALTEALPGTQSHHNMLVNLKRGDVNQELGSQLEKAKISTEESKPELAETKAALAGAKQGETAAHHQAQIDVAREHEAGRQSTAAATHAANLAAHGFKQDEQGRIVPLPYEEMSEPQKAVHDLKASQDELANATAELRRAQKENVPKAAELAQARIDTARKNAATAAGRLGLSQKEYEANYFGTVGGEPIPGAPADEEGKAIGLKTAALTKPSGQVQSRAAQGTAIKKAGDALIQEIDAKKGKVGNLESYWNQAIAGTPISDPEASGLMTSLASFAALQPGLHGFRSHDAMREFAKNIGGIPKNPEALKASIRSIMKTAGIVEEGGQVRHVKTGGGEELPGGVTLDEVNAEIERRKKKK